MASRENSAMNEGQMWNVWADCIGLKISDSDEDDADAEKKKIESDAMKLRKDDMPLFGLCPAWDDFFLAVCEMCGYVVKPQSLKNHIELRHGNAFLVRSERSEAAMQHSKSSSTTGKGASSIIMPNKSVSSQGAKSSSSSSPRHHSKTSSHSHGSNHPSSSHNSSSSGNKPERTKPTPKTKKNNSLAPIVRMERIPQSLMKTAATSQSNSAPGDKKELPSPQQPPPVAPVSGSTVSSSTSGPGPGHTPSLSSGNPLSPDLGHVTTSHLGIKSEGPYQGLKKQPTSNKSKRPPKERKLLLCKDREYDANKHCGVAIAETGKPCTRSLTCKTHSLSLRRAVVGRKKNFDDLLSDHRAAKEASVKVTSVKGSPLRPNSGDRVENQQQLLERDNLSGASTTVPSAKSASGLNKVNASSSSSQFRSPVGLVSSQNSAKASSTQGIPPNRISSATHVQDLSDAQEDEKRHQDSEQTSTRSNLPDPPYINRHPRPVAVCTFGMRQLGNGLLMTDRRWDFVRAALKAALTTERSNHPPPMKKLCVESRLPPVPEPVDPSDPYSFTCSEPSSVASSVPHTTASKSAIATTTEVVHSHNPLSTTSGKTKTSTVPTTSSVTSHKPAQPKIITTKTKEKSNSVNKTSSNSPSNPNKKKRTSAHVPNGTSVVSSSPVLPSVSTAATLSPVVVTQTQALSFPVAIGDHLGALSRLQVAGRNSITLSPAIIRNTGISTSSGTSTTTTTKDGNVVVTGLDVLNGQIPVSSALLHSVTVSRPLIATAASGFGITLGATGLMGQLSQLPKSTGLDGEVSSSSSSPGSEKNSHMLSSMLNNSHVLMKSVGNPTVSSWSRTKAKPKVRKNVKTTVVNSVSHASNVVSESHATSILQGSIHTNLSSALNTVSSSHQLPVSSVSCPHLRSESTSSQVPASSPLHNGLGPSPPPPFFSPKGIGISGTMGSNQPLSSPASRGSTPSPGIDMSPPGNTGSGQKGKSFSRLSAGSLPMNPVLTTTQGTFQVSLPLTFSAVSFGGSTIPGTGTNSGQAVSYQQVLATHALSNAQLRQLKLQTESKFHGTKAASASKSPAGLALTTTPLPLKIPLLSEAEIASQRKQPLRLPNDVSERTVVAKQSSTFPPSLK